MSQVVLDTLVLAAVYAVASLSLSFQYGLSGLLNFGQGFLFAVGGYAVAVCYFHDWPIWIGVLGAPLVGALGGLLLALPAKRLSSHYWALMTLGVAELFLGVMRDEDGIAGGALGVYGIPPQSAGTLLAIACAVIVVTIAVFERLRRSQFGLMRVAREDELLVGALGRDAWRIQLVVMSVGGAVAAMGGAMLAFWLTLIAPDVFTLDQVVVIWAMMIIGGRGNMYGAVLGAVLFEAIFLGTTYIPEFWFLDSETTALLQSFIVGLGLVLVLMLRPEGALPERKVRHLGRRGRRVRLSAEGMVKRYGEVTVLDGVSIEAPPGEVTGLIGPNGSGKSTLFDVITGVVPRDGGTVMLEGVELDGNVATFARHGVVRTFQVPRVARRMTVLENLMTAAPAAAGEHLFRLLSPLHVARIRRDEHERRDRALAMLQELGLEHLAEEYAEVLSGGQLKLLSIGIALMLDPRALLLDEPTAGVNPVLIERILAILAARAQAGRTTLLIEHNIPAIAEVCRTVHVLDAGRMIASGTPAAMQTDERVLDAYIGRRRSHAEGKPA